MRACNMEYAFLLCVSVGILKMILNYNFYVLKFSARKDGKL